MAKHGSGVPSVTVVAPVYVRHFEGGVLAGSPGDHCGSCRPFEVQSPLVHSYSGEKFVFFNIAQGRGQDQATKRFTCVRTVMQRKYRPTLSRPIYLPTGAILVTVIVFPSVATSPVNWTFAPAFATRAAKF